VDAVEVEVEADALGVAGSPGEAEELVCRAAVGCP
jgi:hypothetical protein